MANGTPNTNQGQGQGAGGNKANQLQQGIQQHMIDVAESILKYTEEREKNKKHDKIEKAKLLATQGDRIEQDLSLRKLYDITRGSGYETQMGKAFMAPYTKYVKKLYKEYHEAVMKEDDEEKDKAFASLKLLKQEIDAIKSEKTDYGDNMFGGAGGKSKLSKGCSTKQISIADQLYTQNPNLRVVFGEEDDIKNGIFDYYEQIIRVNEQYGIIKDFDGNDIYVNMKEGNKNLFVPPLAKALEYQQLRKEQGDIAREAASTEDTPDLDVGGIAYQIDKLFLERETVLSFCHDDILEDGSTFKEHLYNHRDLTKIRYVDFELGDYDENRDGFIDDLDREKVVDGITNPDSPFFNIELLRDLVTEYFTKKVYIAWGKNLGFDDDWLVSLEVNRVKSNMRRFKAELKKAKVLKQSTFMFDGEQYKTVPNKIVDQPQEQKESKREKNYEERPTIK